VPQICDGGGTELALGRLDEESVLPQDVEDGAHMPQVGRPGIAEDQYVVKEDEDDAA